MVDLIAGNAVAAVAGDRDRYERIGGDVQGDPVAWTKRLVDAGVAGIYLADIDAIVGRPGNDIGPIVESAGDAEVWIDGGRSFRDQNQSGENVALSPAAPPRVIAITASESHFAADLNHRRIDAISLDYRGQRFLGDHESAWLDFAADFCGDVFLIDLQAVGTGTISIGERVAGLRRANFRGRLIAGGGVRGDDDVQRLIDAGCDLVMVGTALHPPGPTTP